MRKPGKITKLEISSDGKTWTEISVYPSIQDYGLMPASDALSVILEGRVAALEALAITGERETVLDEARRLLMWKDLSEEQRNRLEVVIQASG